MAQAEGLTEAQLTGRRTAGETRRENNLIRKFGAHSPEVQEHRRTVLLAHGVNKKGIDDQILREPLAATRSLADRALTSKEIKALASKDPKLVKQLLDAGMAPYEIVRYRLTQPSRLKESAQQERIRRRRDEELPQAAIDRPYRSPLDLSRLLSSFEREAELKKLSFPDRTSQDRRALQLLSDQPAHTKVMREFISEWNKIRRELGREIQSDEGKERARRLLFERFSEVGPRAARNPYDQRNTAWAAFLRFLDEFYQEQSMSQAAD